MTEDLNRLLNDPATRAALSVTDHTHDRSAEWMRFTEIPVLAFRGSISIHAMSERVGFDPDIQSAPHWIDVAHDTSWA